MYLAQALPLPHSRRMLMQRLLRPRSIAVVGASDRTFIGQIAMRNCGSGRFTGDVFPVNRRGEAVLGKPAAKSLLELSDVPDVALIQVKTQNVLESVEDGIRLGVRGFVIPGAGHTDSGDAAEELRAGLALLRRNHEFALVGPNCMGVLDMVGGAAPYVGTANDQIRRGTVAIVAQSGAVIEAFVNSGGRVAISTAVSSGSETITSMADYLNFFAADDSTSAVLAFVETAGDAEAVIAAVRRCSDTGKPVAVCIVGHSAAARAGVAAHSGKLAPTARVTRAAWQQAGAVIADDLDELMAFGEIFSARRNLPGGNCAHVVTNSGGEGNLLSDIAELCKIQLPELSLGATVELKTRWPRLGVRNPLDPWGADEYPEIYPTALQCAATEPGDMVIVAMDQHRASGDHERQLGLHLARYLSDAVSGTTKLPVIVSPVSDDMSVELVNYCRSAAIPLLRGLRPALTALGKLAARSDCPPPRAACPSGRDVTLAAGALLTDDTALDVLQALGVSTPIRISTDNPADAAAVAATIGPAVVLKGVAPGVAHKTELGLVEIVPRDVAVSADRMRQRSGVGDLRYLISELVTGELEVFIGYKRDASFGPTMVLALGGIWTEYLDTASVHVGRLDRTSASRFLDQSTVGHMIGNARGGGLCRSSVITAMLAVSDLADRHPDIVSIDVNPLIVGRNHATAVDAVIERREA